MQAPGPPTQGTPTSYRRYCGQDKALGDLSLLADTGVISEGDSYAFFPSFSKVASCNHLKHPWVLMVLSSLRLLWVFQVSERATKSSVPVFVEATG